MLYFIIIIERSYDMKKGKNNKKWKFIALGLVSIVVIIIIYSIINSLLIKRSINTVMYGDEKINLNDTIKDVEIDFTSAGTTNINNSSDYKYIPSEEIGTLKIKNGYSWSIEKSDTLESHLSIMGFNRGDNDINITDGKIEYIRVKIFDGYDIEKDLKIKVFGNLTLGKSNRHDVVKKITQIGNYKDLIISEASEELYIKISEKQYAKFILNDDWILTEVRLSTYYI